MPRFFVYDKDKAINNGGEYTLDFDKCMKDSFNEAQGAMNEMRFIIERMSILDSIKYKNELRQLKQDVYDVMEALKGCI